MFPGDPMDPKSSAGECVEKLRKRKGLKGRGLMVPIF
eukprot:gene7682-3904_t